MLFTSSKFLNLLNKLDLSDYSISQTFSDSFFVKKIGYLLSAVRKKTDIFANSLLLGNIDNIILFLLSLILISIIFAPTKIIGTLGLGVFLLWMLKKLFVTEEKQADAKKNFFSISGFNIPIFLYISIAMLSVCFSSLFIPSLKGFFKMMIYFGVYLTFIDILKNHPKRILYLLGLLALTVSAEAFYAIYQNFAGIEALATWQDVNEVNPEQLMNRVYGTLKPFNPNLLAGYLVAGLASVIGGLFYSIVKHKTRISIFFGICTLAVLLAIGLTGSRGAYLATAAMSFVFILISGHIIWNEYSHVKWLKKLWLYCIIAGFLAVAALIILSPSLQHRVLSIFAARSDSSNSFRLNVYAATFKMFLDNWIIGIGTGNTSFRLIYGLYMTTGYDALGAYSVPLEIMAESGIFALLAFGWLILMSYLRSIKFIWNNNHIGSKIIVAVCIMAITGMMVHGFVDTIWYRPQINILFWLYIAVLATVTLNKKPEQK
jgi:putative inorganic carbon (HCO3(-)) transporter